MNRKRLLAVWCVLSISTPLARAQDTASPPTSGSETTTQVAEGAPSAPAEELDEPLSVSDLLRANLEETIREGEKVLRGLPQARLKVTRSRLSNLRAQLKRKEREQKELQDSLGTLRADFFRHSAALRRNEKTIDAGVLATREAKLEDDYELHAAFFEEELRALDQDILAIHETIRRLEARTAVQESLRPAPRVESSPRSEAADRVREIPVRLDPFEIESFVPSVRGQTSAPAGLLWALKGEIAVARANHEEAELYWTEALESLSPRHPARLPLLGNLAAVAYDRGDFVASYRIFAVRLGDRDVTSFTTSEVYTMAVLSYLNGLVDDARSYLTYADEEGRRRMASVLGPTAIGA